MSDRKSRLVSRDSIALLIACTLSCTLSQNLDIEQCVKDSDCGHYGSEFADYVCEQDICVPFACKSDDQCQKRRGHFSTYLCADQLCVPPECTQNSDCVTKLKKPNAACEAGRCVDKDAAIDEMLWGCARDNMRPTATKTQLTYKARVLDFNTREPPTDLQARLCLRTDPDCASPQYGPVGVGADGYLSIPIKNVPSTGFDGFVFLQQPDRLPVEFQFFRPLTHDFLAGDDRPTTMVASNTLETFAMLANRPIDVEHSALLVMRLYDCQGKPAQGLKLEVDGKPDVLFFISDDQYIPTVNAKETDAHGIGGLMGVPGPGISRINVRRVKTGEVLYSFPLAVHPKTFILSFLYANDI